MKLQQLFGGLVLPVAFILLAGCSGSGDAPAPTTPGTPNPPPPTGSAVIKVLSNRSDLISAGDALVEVVLPQGSPASAWTVDVDGVDVTSAFALRANGRYMGRITSLVDGVNVLTARASDGTRGSITIVNHPNGGPVFSGPQIQPWVCSNGVDDPQCNQPAGYTFLYKSSDPTVTGLQPYDPDNPPSDVATTTTDDGMTLPFIVRQERGYQDRDEYKILMLFQPGEPWEPWAPQPQWNRKLVITHGGGCGGDHASGGAPLDDYAGTIPANPAFEQSYITALGRGFGVMSTALDNNGHNCNIAVQAESLMMAKERLIEQYGELRYTIGTGCSGGSLVQQQLSNAYPGIYQGLLTMCSYPDTFSAGTQFADYHLLRLYFEDPSRWAVPWTEQQFADVEGHVSHANAVAADEGLFKAAVDPTNACEGVTDEERYHPETNPGGVRCGVLDYMINVFGPRPSSVWTPNEQALNRGFAGVPIDNVGIQYGLEALREGRITPAQFVDLNVKIGGLSIDIRHQAARIVADSPALANAYRSGAINMTNNMDRVPMINFTGADPGIAHDSVHTWWTRWRMDREHGDHDTHIIWSGPAPLIGDPNYVYLGLSAMDRWLSAIEADASSTPLAEKIVQNKPEDIHDQCSDGNGNVVLDDVCPDPILPVYGTPRTVAGDVDTADTMKCHLRPFSREDDYGLIPFTEEQWLALEEVFATGVCDYSQPGVDLQGAIEWMAYQNAAGAVIYGGTPMPAAPANSGAGWASPAFRVFSTNP